MRKEDLDNITLPRHTENKRHKKMGEPLTRTTFCEWAKERGTSVLIKGEKLMIASTDKKLWRAIIASVLKGRGTYKNNKDHKKT